MTNPPNKEGSEPTDNDPMSAGTKVGIAAASALGILFGALLIIGAQHSPAPSAETSSTTTTASGGTPPTTASGPGVVQVTLSDTKGLGASMKLVADKSTAPAGKVTFVVKNAGTIDHEMVVLKLGPGQTWNVLPITDAGDPPAPVKTAADKVSETNNIGETGDPNLKPGDTRTFTIKGMKAGNYALVCNIAKHYGLGMRAGLTVS